MTEAASRRGRRYLEILVESVNSTLCSTGEQRYEERPKEYELIHVEGERFAEAIYRECISEQEDGSFSAIEYRATVPAEFAGEVTPENVLRIIEGADAKLVRMIRDGYLRESDYLMLVDNFAALTTEQRGEVVRYRQALRDITEQPDFPYDVDFPEKPEALKK